MEAEEHGLAIRILARELGEDSMIRIASLPDGWLPRHDTLHIHNDDAPRRGRLFVDYRGKVEAGYNQQAFLNFASSVAMPAAWVFNGDGGMPPLGPVSLGEYQSFAARERVLTEEVKSLERSIAAALAGFTTIERLAQDWPEAYAHFPHPELAPSTLPAARIEDINARIAAAREAA